MPPAFNKQFLVRLQEFVDERDQGTNGYKAYKKAFNGLKAATKEYATPRDLHEVPGIGTKIIEKLERRYVLENGEEPAPQAPPKPRGRPKKRSAMEVESIELAPMPKRLSRLNARDPQQPPLGRPSSDDQVRDRIEAQTSWTEDGTQLLRMKVVYPASQATHPLAAHILFSREHQDGTVVAEMPEDAADPFPQCPGFAEAQVAPPARRSNVYLQRGASAVASGSRDNANNSDMRSAAAARSYASLSQATRPFSVSAPLPIIRSPSPDGAPTPDMLWTFPPFTLRIFKAGQYTIQLLLDARELNEKTICDRFRARGVDAATRTLNLGDVVWIAKQGAEECVLDVVLERKRLDDLVESIHKGRFQEQKFRLHQSGISSVLYLVEEYKLNQNNTPDQKKSRQKAISTTVSSTQVVDRFMVKETRSIDDTVSYLIAVTEELRRAHQNKDLHVIPTEMIHRQSYLNLQRHLRREKPTQCFVTSWHDYQALNKTQELVTVGNTWAQMLQCVKGMSAEKASGVLKRWETPRALWEAFRVAEMAEQEGMAREEEEAAKGKGKGKKKRSTVPEARLMLKGVSEAEGGVRAIGGKLSAKVYELFTSEEY
ncbi:hypothetical protein DFH07DRAFT_1011587 [Mycena maculata]|uniref:Crossover junction endonuclease MUS81 n=1 Tax=Mycena maculata TaxID=230809 RepID=A0AAD7MJ49_9AGAR|nr:hypothetical protein DFH07DRAFT_1011587 [Mycena maculata]